jgi:hypothetical protein
MISLHYTGTDSNTNVSAGSGWTNAFSIMVTGVQRYWQKTFSDSQKNETIRMILGINLVYPECGVQKTVCELLQSKRASFVTTGKLRLGIFTWNLAGRMPPSQIDISDHILPKDSLPVDLFIVGI